MIPPSTGSTLRAAAEMILQDSSVPYDLKEVETEKRRILAEAKRINEQCPLSLAGAMAIASIIDNHISTVYASLVEERQQN